MARSAPKILPSDYPLTTKQAAAFLQVHPRTLQKLVREDLVKAYTLGRHRRFLRADLLKAFTNPKSGGAP